MSGHEYALSDAKDGDWVIITGTSDEDVTMQTLRFGIAEGSLIQIQKNIPRGPVIISKKHVEIAIGRELAKCVSVKSQQHR
ncbi:MAG: ferrous iron transport protein A [Candidatus Obscuribacterales bacterium]|nr:ferrous iron transport protein A [Candidatus Obscuribacterales bacterium]